MLVYGSTHKPILVIDCIDETNNAGSSSGAGDVGNSQPTKGALGTSTNTLDPKYLEERCSQLDKELLEFDLRGNHEQ